MKRKVKQKMEEKIFMTGELGKVCGVLHTIKGAKEIVIIIHGLSSNKDTSAVQTAQILNELGIDAIRIDLDNQGESELDFQTGISIPNYIQQVETTLNYCKAQRYKEISLIGTSYGGLVAFATVLSHPEIKRLLMRAPVVDYEEHANWLYGKEKVKEIIKEGFMEYYSPKKKTSFKINADFITKSYPFSMKKNADKVKIPTRIIQGDKDEQVNYKDAIKVISTFPNAELKLIQGADHALSVNGDYSQGQNVLRDFFGK